MKNVFIKCFFLILISQVSFANQNESCQTDLGFGVILHGESISGYTTSMSLPGTPCSSSMMMVTCINGVLNGPDLYPSCSDILQDCLGVPNGGSVSGYVSPVGPCIASTVTCVNGSLSGPLPYSSCFED